MQSHGHAQTRAQQSPISPRETLNSNLQQADDAERRQEAAVKVWLAGQDANVTLALQTAFGECLATLTAGALLLASLPIPAGPLSFMATGLVISVIFLTVSSVMGSYGCSETERYFIRPVTAQLAWAVSALLIIVNSHFVDPARGVGGWHWSLAWLPAGATGLLLFHILMAWRLRALRDSGQRAVRIAIAGAASQTEKLRRALERIEDGKAYEVVGVFDILAADAPSVSAPRDNAANRALLAAMSSVAPQVVAIALPWRDWNRIIAVGEPFRSLPADVWLTGEQVPAGLHVICHLANYPMIRLWRRPLGAWRGVVKRTEDLVLGGAILALAMLPMLLIALAIRLDSPGPVMIRQRRFGLGNRPITVFKFRSMFWDRGDPSGSRATVRNDPRVTRIGRILRATSLDELPQLLNVLRGDMSLIGPRAHPVEMKVCGEYYHEAFRAYPARHRMKPGITGLAQINGCRGLVDSMEKAQRRLDYDLHYVENWSLRLDLRILFRTLRKGFIDDCAF